MKLAFKTALFTALASVLFFGVALQLRRSGSMPQLPPLAAQNIVYDGTRAPDFPADLAWFNTQNPLSIPKLRGKIVLLDFWTYGCINCLHIIPDLKKLEAKYPNELVVIGVHSAKFSHESRPENVRNAVLKYGIEHPVVVDKNMRVWSEYTVRAWPTLILINAQGRVAQSFEGEGNSEAIDRAIGFWIAKAREAKQLDETPLKLALERAKTPPTSLRFPGKIAVANGRVWVADSGHHRVVVSDQNGQVLATIGDGEAGLRDGDFASARFNKPQGIFVDGEQIYIADTGNHAIRVVNWRTQTVSTLAGTGKQAGWFSQGGAAKTTALSSPWDVLKIGQSVFIAMAGTHQIWRLDLANQTVKPFAGSGAESRRDGGLLSAHFAQPSGLATDGKTLFVTDAESSCVRAVDISGKTNDVRTLAGGDLFTFGDKDGRGDDVLLQHPISLVFHRDFLYFTDTYNSKIKRLNPRNGDVQTVFHGDLNEPAGVAVAGETLWIADSNNHALKTFDLRSKSQSAPVLAPLETPRIGEISAPKNEVSAPTQTLVFPRNGAAKLRIEANFPRGFKLNEAAPQKLEVFVGARKIADLGGQKVRFPLEIALPKLEKSGEIRVFGAVNYCSSGKGALCKAARVDVKNAFEIGENSRAVLPLKFE